ncbi:MAG: HAD family hydrolase [Erysipelotrichaceae bacterium]|nr:HAD family hydrolase [Erysipelotrichaceae bacterium]
MKLSNIKLVVCDIDGTLVTNDHVLTERTKAIIERLHSQNILFGIASGRSIEQHLSKQASIWGLSFDFDIIIGLNGAEMWDGINQKQHDYYKLKREWLKEIIELMAPLNLNPYVYVDGMSLYLKNDPAASASALQYRSNYRIVDDVSELYEKETAKILFRMSEERMAEVEPYVKAHSSEHYKAFKTQKTVLEFSDRRVSKAVPLQDFCTINNIDLSQVLSFGDMTNDNELLEASGIGVCLINGGDDTKAIADYITEKSNEEDGFADFLDKHFFDALI